MAESSDKGTQWDAASSNITFDSSGQDSSPKERLRTERAKPGHREDARLRADYPATNPIAAVLNKYHEGVAAASTCNLSKIYSSVNVQLIAKAVTSVPFLVLWALWITGFLEPYNSWKMIAYNLMLSGSIITYPWFVICACFNLPLILDVWSIFSIFWSMLCLLCAVQLHRLEPTLSVVLLALALMCLVEGLLSIVCGLPKLPEEPEEPEETSRPLVGLFTYRPPRDEPLFFYIPLDGGSPAPITGPLPEYPSWQEDLAAKEEEDHLYWEARASTSKNATVVHERGPLSEERFQQQVTVWLHRDPAAEEYDE